MNSPSSPSKVAIVIDGADDEEDGKKFLALGALGAFTATQDLLEEEVKADGQDGETSDTDSETQEAFRISLMEPDESNSDEDQMESTLIDETIAGKEARNAHKMHQLKKKKKKKKFVVGDPNKHAAKREKMKEKIVKDVTAKILPDIGAFDATTAIQIDKRKSGCCVSFLKLLGCVHSSLNEAISFMSLKTLKSSIKKLTKEKKLAEYINAYDASGRTPLINAIITKRAENIYDPNFSPNELIEALLDAGADVNVPDQFMGMTPLLYSGLAKDEELFVLFLEKGADINLCDYACVTPTMSAAGFGLSSALAILLNKVADVDAVDENGWTCVHYAAWGGFPKCLKVLLNNGADRSTKDLKGRKALDIARYREDWNKKNPPLTRDEILDLHGRDWGVCIALLEDSKSRIADVDDGDDFS